MDNHSTYARMKLKQEPTSRTATFHFGTVDSGVNFGIPLGYLEGLAQLKTLLETESILQVASC